MLNIGLILIRQPPNCSLLCSEHLFIGNITVLHNPHVVLIQYIADHTEFQPRLHGNSVFNNRTYKRTCPSVIADMRAKPQDDNITTYQDLVNNECPNEQQAVLKPRNIKQVRNNKYIARKNAKLSHDDYYNLLLISNELES